MTAKTKKCTGCNKVKPIDQFGLRRKDKTLRVSRCKACVYAWTKAWVKKNYKRHLEYQRNYSMKKRKSKKYV